MELVRLKGIFYRQSEFIGIYFENHPLVDAVIRKCAFCRWSKSNECWLMPMSRENYQILEKLLYGIAQIDNAGLKNYFSNRPAQAGTKVFPGPKATALLRHEIVSKRGITIDRDKGIDEVNRHVCLQWSSSSN